MYRWRQVMPSPLTMEQIGADDPETQAAKQLLQQNLVRATKDDITSNGLRLISGTVNNKEIELLLDGDGRIMRGKCTCSHHFANGLRKGPCRHLQALRNKIWSPAPATSLLDWFNRLVN